MIKRIDCKHTGIDQLGIAKTCVTFKGDTVQAQMPRCIDKPLTACTLDSTLAAYGDGPQSQLLSCSPTGDVVTCEGNGSPGHAFLNTAYCMSPANKCVALESGLSCLAAPLVSCDPAAYPICDGGFLKKCVGSVAGGFLIAAIQRTCDITGGAHCE
ncbi:MAG TPA: hypothetical protein VLU43_08555 [Anaeromyxobacteraceae bacterium]|nr:hypothetical protein [Anaeromyxobacteraceae bacterium]